MWPMKASSVSMKIPMASVPAAAFKVHVADSRASRRALGLGDLLHRLNALVIKRDAFACSAAKFAQSSALSSILRKRLSCDTAMLT